MIGCDRLVLLIVVDPDQVALQYPSRGTQDFYYDEHGGRLESELAFTDDAAIHVRFNLAKKQMRLEFNPSRVEAVNLCPFDRLPKALSTVLRHVDAELGIGVHQQDVERAVLQRWT